MITFRLDAEFGIVGCEAREEVVDLCVFAVLFVVLAGCGVDKREEKY
jgi:hypothetical protein